MKDAAHICYRFVQYHAFLMHCNHRSLQTNIIHSKEHCIHEFTEKKQSALCGRGRFAYKWKNVGILWQDRQCLSRTPDIATFVQLTYISCHRAMWRTVLRVSEVDCVTSNTELNNQQQQTQPNEHNPFPLCQHIWICALWSSPQSYKLLEEASTNCIPHSITALVCLWLEGSLICRLKASAKYRQISLKGSTLLWGVFNIRKTSEHNKRQ